MKCNFPNVGYTKNILTEHQLFPIKVEIDKIKNNFVNSKPFNTKLAGNIDRSYALDECFAYTQHLLLPYIKEYQNDFQYYLNYELRLQSNWVNYQRKYEFNPSHIHDGILSYVIWITIPFLNENETKVAPGKHSNTFIPGNFRFTYLNSVGCISHYDIPADQTYENTILIFPSHMTHSVQPFYSSNDYRISVSGNFV
jgi:hypothetical protein